MKNKTKKLVCIVMSVCLIATGAPLCSPIVSVAKSSSTQVSQEQRKEELEKQLAETDKKLKELGKEKRTRRSTLMLLTQSLTHSSNNTALHKTRWSKLKTGLTKPNKA